MDRPVARYTSSRRYLWLGLLAAGGALLSAWTAWHWPAGEFAPAWIAVGLFAFTALPLLLLAFRPPVEIRETHLVVGRRAIAWSDIRRIDRTRWSVPLGALLTLADDSRVLVVYGGDLDSSTSLLRHLRRYSREALLDGIPYRQFWGETTPLALPKSAAPEPKQLSAPRPPLLLPEDEEEVERMFQRLKAVGRLPEFSKWDHRSAEQRHSDDE